MEKKQQIDSLLLQIKELEEEIKILRDSCSHEKKTIRFVNQNSTHSNGLPKWVCDICGGVTGTPAPIEVEEWLKT